MKKIIVALMVSGLSLFANMANAAGLTHKWTASNLYGPDLSTKWSGDVKLFAYRSDSSVDSAVCVSTATANASGLVSASYDISGSSINDNDECCFYFVIEDGIYTFTSETKTANAGETVAFGSQAAKTQDSSNWTSAAPVPDVVWDGNFSTDVMSTDMGDYTLYSGDGNTVAEDGSSITIGSVEPVKISFPQTMAEIPMTVIIKYRGYINPQDNQFKGFISLTGENANDSSDDYTLDLMGIAGTAAGGWGPSWQGVIYKSDGHLFVSPQIPERCDKLAMIRDPDAGLGVWREGTRVMDVEIKAGRFLVNQVNLGGIFHHKADGTAILMNPGLVIEGVAIFSKALTDEEIESFSFVESEPIDPEPDDPPTQIEVTPDISLSATTAEFSDTLALPTVTVAGEYAEGTDYDVAWDKPLPTEDPEEDVVLTCTVTMKGGYTGSNTATFTVTPAPKAYPEYIGEDDRAKYDAWVEANAITDRVDTHGELLKAYAFNVSPAEADDEADAFKVKSISVGAEGIVQVESPLNNSKGADFNGTVEIWGSATVDGDYNLDINNQACRYFKVFLCVGNQRVVESANIVGFVKQEFLPGDPVLRMRLPFKGVGMADEEPCNIYDCLSICEVSADDLLGDMSIRYLDDNGEIRGYCYLSEEATGFATGWYDEDLNFIDEIPLRTGMQLVMTADTAFTVALYGEVVPEKDIVTVAFKDELDNGFATLSEAFAGGNGLVTLVEDYTLDEDVVLIRTSETKTLDLAGKTITIDGIFWDVDYAISIAEDTPLTIVDSVGGGKIVVANEWVENIFCDKVIVGLDSDTQLSITDKGPTFEGATFCKPDGFCVYSGRFENSYNTIDSILGAIGESEDYDFEVVEDGNYIVVRKIEKTASKVNLTISAENATVSGVNEGTVSGGDNLIFTVSAAEGYAVVSVAINGETIAANENGEYCYVVPDDVSVVAIVVTAELVPVDPVVPKTYALTIPDVAGATAAVTTENGEAVEDLSAIPEGTTVVVTWTAADGYTITEGVTETLTMDADKVAATPKVSETKPEEPEPIDPPAPVAVTPVITLSATTAEFSDTLALPTVTVAGGYVEGSDYDVAWDKPLPTENPEEDVVLTCTVTMKGGYTGSNTATFTVTPKAEPVAPSDPATEEDPWLVGPAGQEGSVKVWVDPALSNLAAIVVDVGDFASGNALDLQALEQAMTACGYVPAVTPLNALVKVARDGGAPEYLKPVNWLDANGVRYANLEAAISAGVTAVVPDFFTEEAPEEIVETGTGDDGETYAAVVENKPTSVTEPVKAVRVEGLVDLATGEKQNVRMVVTPANVADVASDVVAELTTKLLDELKDQEGRPVRIMESSIADLSVYYGETKQSTLGSLIAIHIPRAINAECTYGVSRIHDGVATAIPEVQPPVDVAGGAECFVVDAAANEIVLYVKNFSDYLIAETQPDTVELSIPVAENGCTYVVSNATTGAELVGELVDGMNTYEIPYGHTVRIYYVPEKGCRLPDDFVNPVELPEVKADVTVAEADMPSPRRYCDGLCGWVNLYGADSADATIVYDFQAKLKTTVGKKGKATKTTYKVSCGRDESGKWWWEAAGYADNDAAKAAVLRMDNDEKAALAAMLGFDPVTGETAYGVKSQDGKWCVTFKFTEAVPAVCYRAAGSKSVKTSYRFGDCCTDSVAGRFADVAGELPELSTRLLNLFGAQTRAKANKVEVLAQIGDGTGFVSLRLAGQGSVATLKDAHKRTAEGVKSVSGSIVGILPGPDCENCCDFDEPALVFDCSGAEELLPSATAAFGTFTMKFNAKKSVFPAR